MSIYRVTQGDVEALTVVTNPIRQYVSSSTAGSTGSVYVFSRRSSIEKDVHQVPSFIDGTHQDSDISMTLRSLQRAAQMSRLVHSSSLSGTLPGMLEHYLTQVNQLNQSAHKQKVLEINRFTPDVNFGRETTKKLFVKDILQRYYRTSYPSANWAYTNFNCLNFFTSSTVPTSSVLLYPNIAGGDVNSGHVSGTYSPSGSFTFDFYIKPKYTPDQPGQHFKAGTLLHLSSTYAVSLVTGTLKDPTGRPSTFRIQLQLSQSADVVPSRASVGSYPNDLIFLSDDNSLLLDRWHHVIIRWGTNLINEGTGSFVIDGVDKGTFVVPSSSITPFVFSGKGAPDVLCVGNFYEGTNSGSSAQALFFAADPALRDGLQQLIGTTSVNEPASYAFNHPLNAEVHDVAIKRYYMSDADIIVSASQGPKSIDTNEIAFYLPPFFVEESPYRQSVGGTGGVLQTPFFEADGSTSDPFNVAMAFGVDGHYINIENFLRDFASNVFPRVHHMTASVLSETSIVRSANEFLYAQERVRRRNLLILPCDDGLFVPSFELLASESLQTRFIDDLGVEELSFINLDNMVATSSLLFGSSFESEDKTTEEANAFIDETIGFTPEQPGLPSGPAYIGYVRRATALDSSSFNSGVQAGAPLSIYQRTRDPSSNQVTFFDISNLFYGKRILPGSVVLSDPSLSGSGGAISITLKDDAHGNLYRADCITSQSSWNCVGNVYYDEGIIVIKSPHLYFFGQDAFEISFRGEQSLHVMKIEVLAPANQLNSSSNPNYQLVAPSPYPNDPESEFVYISNINFHDDNFNVIAKTQLAQPIMKRPGDRISFKCKIDF